MVMFLFLGMRILLYVREYWNSYVFSLAVVSTLDRIQRLERNAARQMKKRMKTIKEKQ